VISDFIAKRLCAPLNIIVICGMIVIVIMVEADGKLEVELDGGTLVRPLQSIEHLMSVKCT
jgi:hypothetical protein